MYSLRLNRLWLILTCAAALALSLAACAGAAPTPAPSPAVTAAPPLLSITSTPAPTLTQTLPPSATPGPDCMQSAGVVRPLSINSDALQRTLHFNLYLPPCYDPQQPGGYPVLYLLHGQTYNENQWVNLGAPEAADRLISSGAAAPFLIVMPQEADTLANPFSTGFEQALTAELVPWINANAAVCAQRECQAIGGLSRGASWAVWIGFAHPQLFSAIGAHSLPPFYGTEGRMTTWLAEIPAGGLPRVWMDIGANDPYLPDASAFETVLTRLDIPHTWEINSGNHEDSYWSEHVEAYLRWYAQGWTAVPTPAAP